MAGLRMGAYRLRRGFTLIEMLVAVAVTMIMMFAIVRFFQYIGDNINTGRAAIELSGQLRNTTHRLQQDLDGATALLTPWVKTGSAQGYFEIIEGPNRDSTAGASSMWGDRDDVLMFTARAKGQPFVGRHPSLGTIESEYAEIIWWAQPSTGTAGAPQDSQLFRRVLLIRPDVSTSGCTFANSDLSMRSGSSGLVANSLEDLTLRQNRFGHGSGFPHAMVIAQLQPLSGTELGNDVILSNLLGFDVRVYDPMAPIRETTYTNQANQSVSVAVSPGDAGWTSATTHRGRGAFVDLGYANNTGISFYSGAATAKSGLTSTYDTWPFYYEHDGVNQDNDSLTDEGTDGFDSNNNNITDDPTEYETLPPYPNLTDTTSPFFGKFPALRAIQVRLRMYEPDSRQVRQATVSADFSAQ